MVRFPVQMFIISWPLFDESENKDEDESPAGEFQSQSWIRPCLCSMKSRGGDRLDNLRTLLELAASLFQAISPWLRHHVGKARHSERLLMLLNVDFPLCR
jgi:hypothetical protein